MRLKYLSFFIILSTLTACNTRKLQEENPTPSLINQFYSYELTIYDGDEVYTGEYSDFYILDGNLPDGLEFYKGLIYGTPLELGVFSIKIGLNRDYECDDSNSCRYDYDDVQRYQFIVTEPSTNPDCPALDSTEVEGVTLCAGSITNTDGILAGETLDLDITYLLNSKNAVDYLITSLTFSITYDPTLFSIDPAVLTSELNREAASFTQPTVSFVNETPGVLTITLTAKSGFLFEVSGRFMDIPLTALTDIPLETSSTFSLSVLSLTSRFEGMVLPIPIEISGSLE